MRNLCKHDTDIGLVVYYVNQIMQSLNAINECDCNGVAALLTSPISLCCITVFENSSVHYLFASLLRL